MPRAVRLEARLTTLGGLATILCLAQAASIDAQSADWLPGRVIPPTDRSNVITSSVAMETVICQDMGCRQMHAGIGWVRTLLLMQLRPLRFAPPRKPSCSPWASIGMKGTAGCKSQGPPHGHRVRNCVPVNVSAQWLAPHRLSKRVSHNSATETLGLAK